MFSAALASKNAPSWWCLVLAAAPPQNTLIYKVIGKIVHAMEDRSRSKTADESRLFCFLLFRESLDWPLGFWQHILT
jgi:hypothetical protein